MSKTMWVFFGTLGITGAGYLMYRYYEYLHSGTTMSPQSNPSAYSPSQPSATFPFRPTVDPRVDNSNQPWYGGSQTAVSGQSAGYPAPQTAAQLIGAGSSIIHSLEDLFGSTSASGDQAADVAWNNNWDTGPTSQGNLANYDMDQWGADAAGNDTGMQTATDYSAMA